MSNCLSCLKEIEDKKYCNACLKKMFRGKVPSLTLNKTDFQTSRYEMIDHFSISGVQDKISLKLEGEKLIATISGGEYLLKPVPDLQVPNFQNDIPANEHLTMQIAHQIFRISTAENALIMFNDGEPAYITKRFDRRDGLKIRQEDFCQIGGKSPETGGPDFKYEGSYQEMGEIIFQFCSAPKIEIEKLFKLILFNYIFGNGDAHYKNFSLIESINGDFVFSPAYDLLSTNIHFPHESRLALDLFNDFETDHFKNNGFYGYEDFMKLADFYRIKENRATKIMSDFTTYQIKVASMISKSFLSDEAKKEYLNIYLDRLKAMVR